MHGNVNHTRETDLKELLTILWNGKYFIIIIIIISIAAGSFYIRNINSEYKVSVLLAPVQEEQTTPSLNGLNGLASLAGISLPSGSASDFAKYEIMLKTQEIASLVFQDRDLIQELFFNEWDNNQQIFFEPKQSKPMLIINYMKKLITGKPPEDYISPNPARLKAFIDKNVHVRLDKKTKYLNLFTDSSNPKLSTKLLDSMINNTDQLFKKKFIKQSNDAIQFYQIKIAKARSQEQREILATLIVKEERELLLATRDGPFVAEILTGPNISLFPSSPRPSFILTTCILLGGFLSFILLLIRNFLFKNYN